MSQALASSSKSPETVLRLVSLLREFDAATLVTRTRAGSLHGRPMSIAQVEDNVTLWFVTSVASAKVDEVAEDARAMVTLQSPTRFVCLTGNAELVFDPLQIRALWKDEYRVWYQDDADPDIVLVRFTSFDAEYWDKSGLQSLSLRARRHDALTDPESHAKVKLWDPSESSDPQERDA